MKHLTIKELEIIKQLLEFVESKTSDPERLEEVTYLKYRIEDIINHE